MHFLTRAGVFGLGFFVFSLGCCEFAGQYQFTCLEWLVSESSNYYVEWDIKLYSFGTLCFKKIVARNLSLIFHISHTCV